MSKPLFLTVVTCAAFIAITAINGGRALHQALAARNIRHEWTESPGYRHDYQIWRIYLNAILPKLFRN